MRLVRTLMVILLLSLPSVSHAYSTYIDGAFAGSVRGFSESAYSWIPLPSSSLQEPAPVDNTWSFTFEILSDYGSSSQDLLGTAEYSLASNVQYLPWSDGAVGSAGASITVSTQDGLLVTDAVRGNDFAENELAFSLYSNVLYSITLSAFSCVSSYSQDVFAMSRAALSLDYDLSETSPTPIPGAIWLLGSGLVAMISLRRRMQA